MNTAPVAKLEVQANTPQTQRVPEVALPAGGADVRRPSAVRMTWASIVLSVDPILREKSEPRVIERRARFRRVVQVTLAGCLALCVAAVVATVGGEVPSTGAAAAIAPSAKAAPAVVLASLERLEAAKRSKSPTRHLASATPRTAKRRY